VEFSADLSVDLLRIKARQITGIKRIRPTKAPIILKVFFIN